MKQDYVQSFSAHAALFTIMSLFPLAMFLITFIKKLPIKFETVIGYANDFLPDTVRPLILQIIDEVYHVNGTGIKWITLITIIYCASKGFYAIRLGLNAIYGIKESRNIVYRNIIVIVYVLVFSIMLITMMLTGVIGGDLLNLVIVLAPELYAFKGLMRFGRLMVVLILLTLVFLAMYVVIPNRKTKFKFEIRGAIFSSIGWTVFSYAFSFYKSNVAQYTVIYGSLATMVILMLWFYISMYIFFLGAECNYFYRKYIENGKDVDKVIHSMEYDLVNRLF